MACTDQVFVGDIGTAFQFTLYECDEPAGTQAIVDISSASAQEVIFLKPDGTTKLTKTGSFVTDGTDGKTQYITITGDIDTAGTWKAQAKITIGSGVWYSTTVSFKVKDPL